MPTISFSSSGPLTANVHLDGTTARDVAVNDLGQGLVSVELAGVDVGVRLSGRLDVIQALIGDAYGILTRMA